ncbi:hypothetical protein [Capnocytophaga catalasegens]|uniref:Uncharacterized protein n=1 Tax=Capnocytophaga catalasegens TaxID=1004260 RepID=A0AAV5AW11_9FLAO|nr:hypothetical protein [Capnocytophaga catalasegens]GIZ15522.1 hypothetical protein RCZ03_15220 [Capnocytophaga catalasegens]GJM49865.1 hypothetical protein RCZ15_08400 [Capnocytophaga catalasegens]GJM54037.1 hypothetical protein RCZ16_23530 [Capnocytophaga catalasegens]
MQEKLKVNKASYLAKHNGKIFRILTTQPINEVGKVITIDIDGVETDVNIY